MSCQSLARRTPLNLHARSRSLLRRSDSHTAYQPAQVCLCERMTCSRLSGRGVQVSRQTLQVNVSVVRVKFLCRNSDGSTRTVGSSSIAGIFGAEAMRISSLALASYVLASAARACGLSFPNFGFNGLLDGCSESFGFFFFGTSSLDKLYCILERTNDS